MGQLAEKDLIESDVPVKIMDGVKAISGLSALKNDGSVWIWGGDIYRLAKSQINKPKMVFKNAKAVSYGDNYIYIIDNKGVLYGIANPNTSIKLKDKEVKISEGVEFINKKYFIKNDKTLWYNAYEDFDISTQKIKPILKNVKYADSYHNSGCAVKEDGTLWAWNLCDANGRGLPKGSYSYPQKIMSGVKYANCGFLNVVAVKKDGSICSYGAGSPEINYSLPKIVMKNVKEVFDNGWVLSEDDILWRFKYDTMENPEKIKIIDNVKTVLDDGIIEKNDGTSWTYSFDNWNSYLGKKFSSHYEILTSSLYLDSTGKLFTRNVDPKANLDNYREFGELKEYYYTQSLIFVIKKDNSLWVSLREKNGYTPEAVKTLSMPVKILDDVKEISTTEPYIFAISNSGELATWYINTKSDMNTSQSYTISLNPQKVMDNVDSFDKEKYSIVDIIKKDKSHWYFTFKEYTALSDYDKQNFGEYVSKQAVKDIDSMEEVVAHNKNLYIKKNGELWIRGFGKLSAESYREKASFVKVMENVKYAETDSRYGIAVCNDGSLWDFCSLNYTVNSQGEPNDKNFKPRKLLEKVSDICMASNEQKFAALNEDGSLYTWQYSLSGDTGKNITVSEPQEILEDVVVIKVSNNEDMIALKKDGTLMHWGSGPSGFEFSYVDNPINCGSFDKNSLIQHRNYESAGVNEDIEIIVKIFLYRRCQGNFRKRGRDTP
jgi:alpha-tubulin suppressor-like RCC1 family protein